MRKGKRFLSALVIMTFVFSMMLGTTAFAKEIDAADENAAVETADARASSTIVGPDGYVYQYLGTADRQNSRPIEAMLRQTISASDGVHIVFYCPNKNGNDLVQGKVTAIPVFGGTVQTFSFLNFYNEVSDINLSNLSGTGKYRIEIRVDAVGTSNKGDVYYRAYQ